VTAPIIAAVAQAAKLVRYDPPSVSSTCAVQRSAPALDAREASAGAAGSAAAAPRALVQPHEGGFGSVRRIRQPFVVFARNQNEPFESMNGEPTMSIAHT
jgi:hypothetical protein